LNGIDVGENLLSFLEKNPKKEIFFGDRWGIPDEDSGRRFCT